MRLLRRRARARTVPLGLPWGGYPSAARPISARRQTVARGRGVADDSASFRWPLFRARTVGPKPSSPPITPTDSDTTCARIVATAGDDLVLPPGLASSRFADAVQMPEGADDRSPSEIAGGLPPGCQDSRHAAAASTACTSSRLRVFNASPSSTTRRWHMAAPGRAPRRLPPTRAEAAHDGVHVVVHHGPRDG